MIDNKVTCKIEHHAILFALLSKNAILLAGEAGKEAILKGMTEYGKYYCVNVDNAVYQGFRSDFLCTPTTTSLSWGGERCEFDREHPEVAYKEVISSKCLA